VRRRTLPVLAGALLTAAGLYGLRRHFLRRALHLGPVRTDVRVRRGLKIPMPDGVNLVADHYRPKKPGAYPTILIRTPYSRGGLMGIVPVWSAQRIAERGYHVIVQDTRGRFASGGEFTPFVHEAGDGRATIDWIAAQPWCNGAIGMWGQSYGGFVQWAAARSNPQPLKALVPIVTRANFTPFGQAGIELDTFLRWTVFVEATSTERDSLLERLRLVWKAGNQERMAGGHESLPILEADVALVGREVTFYRRLAQEIGAGGEAWQEADMSGAVVTTGARVHFIGGWYDLFIGGLLEDYRRRLAAGHSSYLTIGPWTHFANGARLAGLRLGLDWFDAHLKGQKERLREKPVRYYLMGADQWRELESWPPPTQELTLYLQPEGQLISKAAPDGSPPGHYVYDPADPTPSVGGPLLSPDAGTQDNRPLEARPDVLTYTTEPLAQDVDIAGAARLVLYVFSSREHTAFFGRLCDVQPDGRSLNVCDGLARLSPGRVDVQPDGSWRVEIPLSPTAQRFRQGHRIRLQVSSGAHPRFMREYGTGEAVLTATTMVAAEQTVYHDPARPSALILPQDQQV
jgi:uncharacterized protein